MGKTIEVKASFKKSDEVINHEELDYKEERIHPKEPKPTRGRSESYSRSVNDHTNPEGWKSSERDGKNESTSLSPPEENQFPCSKAAPHNLINTRASKRQGELKAESLEPNDDLPPKRPLKEVNIENIQVFANDKAKEKLSTISSWQKDQNMPKGWKPTRDENTIGNIFFPPTSGQQFNNRKSCLQYILKQEGREKSQDLPHGWMLKNTKQKTGLKNLRHQILTNIILLLWIIGQSRGSKERFNNNLPSGWKVGIGTNELGAPASCPITSRESVLEYRFQGNNSAKEIRGMIFHVQVEEWESNQNIPVGWSWKENFSSDQLLQSIKAVLEHMQASTDYTDNQIKAIGTHCLKQNSRKQMNQEIWSDDATLPHGWKSKLAWGFKDGIRAVAGATLAQ